MKRRVGILGGAFNPPHLGHLKLAELAMERLDLNEVRFVPTALSPHKATEGPDGQTRLRLLDVALQGHPIFRVDPIEVERGGASYTADTLEELHRREPDSAWILLLGSDQAGSFASWREPQRILSLASLAITPRPAVALELPELLAGRERESWSGNPGELILLPSTELPFASTRLRAELAESGRPEGIPEQVLDAISRENLYR